MSKNYDSSDISSLQDTQPALLSAGENIQYYENLYTGIEVTLNSLQNQQSNQLNNFKSGIEKLLAKEAVEKSESDAAQYFKNYKKLRKQLEDVQNILLQAEKDYLSSSV